MAQKEEIIMKASGIGNIFDEETNDMKTDNGWYHINDKKPEAGQIVLVVMERQESAGCSYVASIQEALYNVSGCSHYFSGENELHKVRFWREIVEYPYPNAVVRKEVEQCKKRNIYPLILDYQKKLGYEYKEDDLIVKISKEIK